MTSSRVRSVRGCIRVHPVPVAWFGFVIWMYIDCAVFHPPEKVVNLIEKKNTSGKCFIFKMCLSVRTFAKTNLVARHSAGYVLHDFLRGRRVSHYFSFESISFAKTPNAIKRNKQVSHRFLTLMRPKLS